MSIPKSRGNVTVNKKKIKKKIGKAVKDGRLKLTPEERELFASRRRALEGKLITQNDVFEGAMVLSHIRGSQYLVRLVDGEEVHASHKRNEDDLAPSHPADMPARVKAPASGGFSHGGWALWK